MKNKNKIRIINLRKIFGIALVVCMALGTMTADASSSKSLKAKKYKEDFTVSSGKTLQGKGQGKTIIKGTVKMKNGSTLRNLTISGGHVLVSSGASVTIENVTIDRASGSAAIVTVGGGTLTLRNSRIKNSTKKGMYIQRGKHIVLTGNVISGNHEEAIDIRSKVSGIISGNTITNNGESGIEVILGRSSLKITGNTLTGNGSSGIAAQFYTLDSTIGGLDVSKNTMNNNSNYGIDCKIPSGGNPPQGYWYRSVFLDRSNTVVGNHKGDFAPRCGNLFRQIAAQEAREYAEELARKKEQERQRRAQKRAELDQQLQDIQPQIDELSQRMQHVQSQLDAQNTWQKQFGGGYRETEQIAQNIRDLAQFQKERLEFAVSQAREDGVENEEEADNTKDDAQKSDQQSEREKIVDGLEPVISDDVQQKIDGLFAQIAQIGDEAQAIQHSRQMHEWKAVTWWRNIDWTWEYWTHLLGKSVG